MRPKRETNIEIAAAARRLQLEEAELLCECARDECTVRIVVPLDDFDGLGEDVFVVAAEHASDRHRRLVEDRDTYVLVERNDG